MVTHKRTVATLILSLFIALFFAACSTGNDGSDDEEPLASADLVIESMIAPDTGDKTVKASIYSSTFDDATELDTTLAFTSFCMSMAATKEASLTQFFSDLGFDTVESGNMQSDSYDDTSVADSISYGFAHYEDGEYDVIVYGKFAFSKS